MRIFSFLYIKTQIIAFSLTKKATKKGERLLFFQKGYGVFHKMDG
jgi:hypothetical protein